MSKGKVLKVVIGGEGGVGKTTLLHRYIEGRFIVATQMTIGVEFFLKELEVDEKKILLQIWDFGGQERFRFLLKNYARGAKGALFLFDLTRPISLEKIEEWLDICRVDDQNVPVLLIGSKLDIVDEMLIEESYIEEIKEKYSLFDFLKVSSKTGENVDLAFQKIGVEIVRNIDSRSML
jgi:Ras-related protein Rab-11A